jgi:hypothetical protein
LRVRLYGYPLALERARGDEPVQTAVQTSPEDFNLIRASTTVVIDVVQRLDVRIEERVAD